MPVIKVVLFLNWTPRLPRINPPPANPNTLQPAVPQSGWSETYYQSAPSFSESDVANLVIGVDGAPSIVHARMKLLPYSSANLEGVRVVNTEKPRASWLFSPNTFYPRPAGGQLKGSNLFDYFGTYGRTYDPSTYQQYYGASIDNAIRVKMQSAGGVARRIFLIRGLPAHIIGPGGGYTGTQEPWLSALSEFTSLITVAPWTVSLHEIDRTTPAGVPILNVSNAAGNNAALKVTTAVQIQKGPGPAYVGPGDLIILRGVKGAYRVGTFWKVLSVDASGANYVYSTYTHRRNVALPSTVNPGATASYCNFVYDPVVSAADEGEIVYNRRTGRPFGLQAGRRPVR